MPRLAAVCGNSDGKRRRQLRNQYPEAGRPLLAWCTQQKTICGSVCYHTARFTVKLIEEFRFDLLVNSASYSVSKGTDSIPSWLKPPKVLLAIALVHPLHSDCNDKTDIPSRQRAYVGSSHGGIFITGPVHRSERVFHFCFDSSVHNRFFVRYQRHFRVTGRERNTYAYTRI